MQQRRVSSVEHISTAKESPEMLQAVEFNSGIQVLASDMAQFDVSVHVRSETGIFRIVRKKSHFSRKVTPYFLD
jgi:hypothetical protein